VTQFRLLSEVEAKRIVENKDIDVLLDFLPQGDVIKSENAHAYLQHLSSNANFESINGYAFYLNRLTRFGGSEAAALLKLYQEDVLSDVGEQQENTLKLHLVHKTPREIIASKLLMKLPDLPTDKAMRGHDLEPVMRNYMARRYQANSIDRLLTTVNEHVSQSQPYMGANLDDILHLNDKVAIIDYKALDVVPPEPKIEEICQLNFYSACSGEIA